MNVIDDVAEECLATLADGSLSDRRLAREPDAIIARRAKPDMIVSDHGADLASSAMLASTQTAQIPQDFILAGKPLQDGAAKRSTAEINDTPWPGLSRPSTPRNPLYADGRGKNCVALFEAARRLDGVRTIATQSAWDGQDKSGHEGGWRFWPLASINESSRGGRPRRVRHYEARGADAFQTAAARGWIASLRSP